MGVKPTIVFIPGFWHTPEGFTPLSKLLQESGYSTVLLPLPSAGAHPGHPDHSQDVAAIRNTLTSLITEDKEVVLVMHSGGGIAGSCAVEDLGKQKGKKGGVVRVVYIGILLPQKGKTMFETFTSTLRNKDLDPSFKIEEDQSYHVIAQDGTSTITDGAARFYNDLPSDQAEYWAGKMTSCSLGVHMSPLTYEAWKYIPASYILCLNDKSIPLRQTREIVDNAGIKTVLEIETGHCPYLSQSEKVKNFIQDCCW